MDPRLREDVVRIERPLPTGAGLSLPPAGEGWGEGLPRPTKRKGRRSAGLFGFRERCPERPRDLLAILLNPRRPEPGEAVLVDRLLPGDELLDGQRITLTRFF